MSAQQSRANFDSMWSSIAQVGLSGTGGYDRFAWSTADLTLREWFRGEATRRSLDVTEDRNGNLWAWWGPPGADAFVTGSHLDSVPGGGAYDGPLGIVTAFAAIDQLREKGLTPQRPVAIVAFSDEEGARFGVACLGSRLLTGTISPDVALGLRDAYGSSLEEVMRRAGRTPEHLGADREALSRIGVFVELHIEQGRGLIDAQAPIAAGSSIWPHGRWRLDFTGRGNHAGTTKLEDRADPMLTYAETVLSVRKRALLSGALATIGKVNVQPGGTNAIASHVTAWLDARASRDDVLRDVVDQIAQRAQQRGTRDGVTVTMNEESRSPRVSFDKTVIAGLTRSLAAAGITGAGGSEIPTIEGVPVLGTGAGHDAGVLSKYLPTGMLFVRNPTGISHSPEEFAEPSDCHIGIDALAAVIADYTAGALR